MRVYQSLSLILLTSPESFPVTPLGPEELSLPAQCRQGAIANLMKPPKMKFFIHPAAGELNGSTVDMCNQFI